MRPIMRKQLRKMMHLKYVNLYLHDLRWEIINMTIAASSVDEMTDAQKNRLINLGNLIRKYERRKRLLKF